MEHNDIRHRLSDYIDGSVTSEEKAAIDNHLKTCEKCSDALRELQKTVEHIKTVEEIDSPAWMTQKIMAKVRAEAEKKTIFHRLFYTLAIKLPIQAVAVLFLTVTAYYVYQGINPTGRYADITRMTTAKNKASTSPATGKDKGASAAKKDALDKMQPSNQAPQSPDYKALDMKQEYEKPAPPIAESKAAAPAPVLAKPAEQPMMSRKKAALETRAVAPAMMQEQTTAAGAAPRSEAKLKSAGQAYSAVTADKAGRLIIVRVKDLEAAAKELEQAITQIGGSITRRENPEAKRVYTVTIKAQKLSELKNKLKLFGKVKDETEAIEPQGNRVELTIELAPDPAR